MKKATPSLGESTDYVNLERLTFLVVYIAYGSWIIWPNVVAVWGGYQRRLVSGAPSVSKVSNKA